MKCRRIKCRKDPLCSLVVVLDPASSSRKKRGGKREGGGRHCCFHTREFRVGVSRTNTIAFTPAKLRDEEGGKDKRAAAERKGPRRV